MNATELLAMYERVADSLDAVWKLRSFVLDLAVRGKLVEQGPSEEPASELLAQLAGLTLALPVGDGAEDSPNEQPFELPSSWSWTRLGSVCSKTGSGSTPRGGQAAYKASGVPFLRSQNVYDDGLRLADVVYIDAATHARMSSTSVLPMDLLLNITGGSMGRCCLVPADAGTANISQHVAIIRPAVGGMSAFIHCLVRSPYFQHFIFGEQTGAGRGGLPKNRMDRIAIPLPPLAEQHRIVAKVDELMALCDRLEAARTEREVARDRLAAASLARLNAPDPDTFQADARFALNVLPALSARPDQVKQLRQTILNLAVRGRLIPQDRQQDSTGHPPVSLPSQSPNRRDSSTTEVGPRDTPIGIQLPASWELATLGAISRKIQYGYTASADASLTDVRMLRITDIQDGSVDWERVPGCAIAADQIAKYKLERDDILIARTGGTIGKSFLIESVQVVAVFASYLIRVQPSQGVFAPYLKAFLGSPFYWEQLGAGTRGTGQPNVNGQTLGGLLVPLPPLAEQFRIVSKVDELMALCDQFEASLATGESTRSRLFDALMHEALESSPSAAA